MKIGQQKRTKKKKDKKWGAVVLHRRKNVYFYTLQQESKGSVQERGENKPTLKDRKRQRNERRGKEGDDRQVKEKKKQKAGESRAMPLSRQEASLMGRKQFICAGKKEQRERDEAALLPGAETMHSTHQKGDGKRHCKHDPQCPSQGHCSGGTPVCITYTQLHTSKIQQATWQPWLGVNLRTQNYFNTYNFFNLVLRVYKMTHAGCVKNDAYGLVVVKCARSNVMVSVLRGSFLLPYRFYKNNFTSLRWLA